MHHFHRENSCAKFRSKQYVRQTVICHTYEPIKILAFVTQFVAAISKGRRDQTVTSVTYFLAKMYLATKTENLKCCPPPKINIETCPLRETKLCCFYTKRPLWCNSQTRNEAYSQTKLIILQMFIFWQQISTSCVRHHQAIAEEHECIQKPSTMT